MAHLEPFQSVNQTAFQLMTIQQQSSNPDRLLAARHGGEEM